MKLHRPLLRLLPALAAVVAFIPEQAQAQTVRTWSNNGTTSIAWLGTGNWTGSIFAGGAPLANPTGEGANADIMGFVAANTGTTAGINMNTLVAGGGVGLILGGIDFNRTSTNAFQIGNSSSTVSGILQLNGATINSVANTLIRVNSGNMTIANVATGATDGGQTLGLRLGIANGIFDVASTRILTINSIISESSANSGFTKSGAGTLTLSGANTYSGTTTISAGLLSLGNVNALQNTSGITLGGASAATLTTQTTDIVITAPITTANTGVTSTIAFGLNGSTAGNITLNGAIGGNGNVAFTTPNVASNNFLQTINLGAAATYAGSTTLSVGNLANTMTVRNSSGAADVLPTTTVLSFGNNTGNGSAGRTTSFDLNGQNQTLAGLNFTGALANDRQLRVTSATAATLTINNATDFSFGGANIDVGGSSPGNTTSAQITGAISLVKNGTGTFTLGGTLTNGAVAQGNSFTGTTKILGGILVLGQSSSIQNSAFDTDGSIAGDATNGLRSSVTFLRIGGLTGSNGFATRFTTTSGGYDALTGLVLNPGVDVSNSYSGNITDSTTGLTLTKAGLGTQTLSGNNTYSGGTILNAGTLIAGSNTAFGATAGNVTVNGGTLDLNGKSITNAITNNGGTVIGSSGSATLNQNGGTLSGTIGGTINASGTVTATSTIITGTLNSGSATFNGAVTIDSGGNLNGTGTFSNGIAFNSGSTLAPGNSPGTIFSNATVTWAGTFTYTWEINDATGVAGTNWDLLNITTGTLDASTLATFTINVSSLGAVLPNFNPNSSYSWSIVTSADPITTFAPGTVNINNSSFLGSNPGTTGTWSVAASGNSLNLLYAPVPEPSTYAALAGLAVLGLAWKRRRRS